MWLIRRGMLKKEAMLFDAPLYILKSFMSVLTAYAVFNNHPIIGNDMISVLFGLMLTLEPVTISGIKSGLDQIKASVLGGVITALIVFLLGVNWFTVPLAVACTLYIALLINWKSVSPVAIFTSIYMTQYIQFNALGEQSMLLTFRLRLLALGSGVLVAILYNYIFSIFFYKSMIRKRMVYILDTISTQFSRLDEARSIDQLASLKRDVSLVFSDIDFVFSHVSDIRKEKHSKENASIYADAIVQIRNLNHYLLDVVQNRINNFDSNPDVFDVSLYCKMLTEMGYALEKKIKYNSDIMTIDGIEEHYQSVNIQYTMKQLMKCIEKVND